MRPAICLVALLALPGCPDTEGPGDAPALRLEPRPAAATPAPARPEAGSTSDPIDVTTLEQARASLGTSVRITGTAANAKLGAVVLLEGTPLYCLELDAWPANVLGNWVEVTGTLERTDQFKATRDEQGAIGQGSAGGDLVFRKMSYQVLAAEP